MMCVSRVSRVSYSLIETIIRLPRTAMSCCSQLLHASTWSLMCITSVKPERFIHSRSASCHLICICSCMQQSQQQQKQACIASLQQQILLARQHAPQRTPFLIPALTQCVVGISLQGATACMQFDAEHKLQLQQRCHHCQAHEPETCTMRFHP
jgi:hypothetical protein